MIFPHLRPGKRTGALSHGKSGVAIALDQPGQTKVRGRVMRSMLWLCLLLACLGGSWFAFQVFLVPQPRSFTPDWHGARWMQASDIPTGHESPVAYFRYVTTLNSMPDRAFLTVAASQVFRLYVNGVYVGSNNMDSLTGHTPQTYMFDIDSALESGTNVIGLRVAHVDRGVPQARAALGLVWGQQTRYHVSGPAWQATAQATLAHPRFEVKNYDWSMPKFQASQWGAAQGVASPPAAGPLMVNPQVYERPLPDQWLSAGAGHESYFVRHVEMSAGFNNALLRIIAIGEADIFINGQQYMRWNGQANTPQMNVVNYLTTNGQPAPYRKGLMLGVYDITPFLHEGRNTIAVHIVSPGDTTAKLGLEALRGAMSLDMLVGDQATNPLANVAAWRVSQQRVADWVNASAETAKWDVPRQVGRPGATSSLYVPDSATPRNVQMLPPLSVLSVVSTTCVLMIAGWFAFGLLALRRYYATRRQALEAASLAFLPALALEALLVTLARQTQLPQPFPYTWQWGLLLVSVTVLSGALLWWQARKRQSLESVAMEPMAKTQRLDQVHTHKDERLPWKLRAWNWLKQNWALIPLVLLTIPMVWYDIGYEPYWQDELSSYYAARYIMEHGYPAFPSGFVYPKAELFSLNLAIVMSLFGTDSYLVTRSISAICFTLSIPLLYLVGSKLFNRKVGWLAAAMLLCTPFTMTWARQARMYEQAQFMVIVVLFVFYWALQNRNRALPVYLAVLSMLLAYFSHEELFIILPAVTVCVLLGSREGPYRLPGILRKKHWWIAALVGAAVITTQLSAVLITHPPEFGTDQSLRPQIQLTFNNVPYYLSILFTQRPMKDSPTVWTPATVLMAVNSFLALAGCLIAFWRKDRRARYCALFLLLSSAMLCFVFTMQADRYYYPLFPVLFLMAAYALWKILQLFWGFAHPHLAWLRYAKLPLSTPGEQRLAHLTRALMIATVTLVCASVLLLPILPLSNYNLFISRVTGQSFRRHYADYDNVAQYMKKHMREDDIVIAVSPAVITLYYVGKVDHFFSLDRALFLFEENNRLVETTSGSHPLLNQNEFDMIMAKHDRIWLVTDTGGYQGSAKKNGRFTFPPPSFRLAYEGYGAAVYFQGVDQ